MFFDDACGSASPDGASTVAGSGSGRPRCERRKSVEGARRSSGCSASIGSRRCECPPIHHLFSLRCGRGAQRRSRVGTFVAVCRAMHRRVAAKRATRGLTNDALYPWCPAPGSWPLSGRCGTRAGLLRVRGRVGPNKPIRAGRRARYFSTVTVLDEKGQTRMSLPGMQALRARTTNRAQVEGVAIAAAFLRPGPKSPPQRAIKEQQLPIALEPFRACQCFFARGHSQPFCAR